MRVKGDSGLGSRARRSEQWVPGVEKINKRDSVDWHLGGEFLSKFCAEHTEPNVHKAKKLAVKVWECKYLVLNM